MNEIDFSTGFRVMTGLVTLVDPFKFCVAPVQTPRPRLRHLKPVGLAMPLAVGKPDMKPGRVATFLDLLHHISQETHVLGMKPGIMR